VHLTVTKYSTARTSHIGIRPATNLLHGLRFARETGRAPTLTLSINWDRLGIEEERATSLFRDLRRRVRRRWKYLSASRPNIGCLDDFGSHENPDGHRNTHWSAYVPVHVQLEFRQTVERLLMKLVGLRELGAAIMFQVLTNSVLAATPSTSREGRR
jgi:hypothetical protein